MTLHGHADITELIDHEQQVCQVRNTVAGGQGIEQNLTVESPPAIR